MMYFVFNLYLHRLARGMSQTVSELMLLAGTCSYSVVHNDITRGNGYYSSTVTVRCKEKRP